jgi:hypothetical protein
VSVKGGTKNKLKNRRGLNFFVAFVVLSWYINMVIYEYLAAIAGNVSPAFSKRTTHA